MTKALAIDVFDGYEREEEQTERELRIERESIDHLIRTYQQYVESISDEWADDVVEHEMINPLAQSYAPQASDSQIRYFSMLTQRDLAAHAEHDHIFGYFLNALVAYSPDQTITLMPVEDVANISYQNTDKHIVVFPSRAIAEVGESMSGGSIEIHGPASNIAFLMSGGKITIHGLTPNNAIAEGMSGGELHLLGGITSGYNVYIGNLGDDMTGGRIYVSGDFLILSDHIKGGDVYHNGKIIVKDGVRQ